MTFNSFKVYRQNFFEYCRLVLKMGGKIFWHCSKNCWIDVKIIESQWLLKCCLRTFICYNYLSNFFEVFWAFLNILLIVESKWWFNSNWEKVRARKCWSMCCVCGGEAYAACTVVRCCVYGGEALTTVHRPSVRHQPGLPRPLPRDGRMGLLGSNVSSKVKNICQLIHGSVVRQRHVGVAHSGI